MLDLSGYFEFILFLLVERAKGESALLREVGISGACVGVCMLWDDAFVLMAG